MSRDRNSQTEWASPKRPDREVLFRSRKLTSVQIYDAALRAPFAEITCHVAALHLVVDLSNEASL